MPDVLRRGDARAAGLKRYFSGAPCPAGHVVERLVSNGRCCACSNILAKSWQQANRERHLGNYRAWRERNLESDRERCRLKAVRERGTYLVRHYHRSVTPAWADRRAINAIYLTCREISKTTGVPHEVDHIVPLFGKNVCGLHVETNLQILPKKINRSKSNRWNP